MLAPPTQYQRANTWGGSMKGMGKPNSADPLTGWYFVAAFGIALLLKFMVTDSLGITSHDEPSTAYASPTDGR